MRFDRRSYFITVAETKNISKAAQILHVSQPSLSQYITRLEEDVGCKLLNRNTNPITLTEAGEYYLQYIQEITAAGNRFEEQINNLKASYADSIIIGIPSQLLNKMFDDYVSVFMREHPDINVTVKEGTSISLRQMLVTGEVDIAMLHNLNPKDSRFTRYIIYDEALLLSCNKDIEFVKGVPSSKDKPIKISPEIITNLEKLRLVSPPGEYLHSVAIDRFCDGVGIHPTKILRLPDVRAIANYIAAPGSDGMSIVPGYLAGEFNKWDDLAYFAPDGMKFTWNLSMDRPIGASLSKAGKLFWDYVVSKSKEIYGK